jgi:hypothetical protein
MLSQACDFTLDFQEGICSGTISTPIHARTLADKYGGILDPRTGLICFPDGSSCEWVEREKAFIIHEGESLTAKAEVIHKLKEPC